MIVTSDQIEYHCSLEEFEQYRNDGYPGLDEGLQDLLEAMVDKDLVPRWSCIGHIGEENPETGLWDEEEGYLAFVAKSPSLAMSWFNIARQLMSIRYPSILFSFEFDNKMLSVRAGEDDQLCCCWSYAIRWNCLEDGDNLGIVEVLRESLRRLGHD